MLKTAVVSALLLTATAGSAQKKRYPYVQDGKIIVCREGTDGVKASLIHPNWRSTPSHQEDDLENNRFAARFEIKENSDWGSMWVLEDELPTCTVGWRYPTIREGRLIIALRGELDPACFGDWKYYEALYVASTNGPSGESLVINCKGTTSIEGWLSRNQLEDTDEYHIVVLCVRDF